MNYLKLWMFHGSEHLLLFWDANVTLVTLEAIFGNYV